MEARPSGSRVRQTSAQGFKGEGGTGASPALRPWLRLKVRVSAWLALLPRGSQAMGLFQPVEFTTILERWRHYESGCVPLQR